MEFLFFNNTAISHEVSSDGVIFRGLKFFRSTGMSKYAGIMS